MVVERKLYTVDEFEEFLALPENRDLYFELINGEITEKPMPTQVHGRLTARFTTRLSNHVEGRNLGYVEVEVRYRAPGDNRNSYQPDISFFADTTTPPVAKGAVQRMPDLAIEIKSPDDTFKGLRDRAAYYIANGVKLVWLVYPEQRLIEVYRPDADSALLTERDTLDGGEVLPGFMLAVSDVFQGI